MARKARVEPKPKHEYRRPRTARTKDDLECHACTAFYGVSTYPCVRDYGDLSKAAQRAFYERHGVCGRCGQVAGTHRSMCRCKGMCGCSDLHDTPVGIDGQEGLFDAPEARKVRRDYEDPG